MTLDDLSALFKPNTPSTQRAAILRDALSATLIVGAALLAWEAAVRARNVPVYILPAPSVIIEALWQGIGYYVRQSLVTLGEALGGLVLGLIIGIAVAILITFWKHLERGILALAILIKTTPLVAIAPLLIIWFGFGPLPKVIITGLITFFPVLINVHSGLHAVDGATLALFHSLNANRWELFRYARWPSTMPHLFDALKVVAPLSLVGAVVAEWAGASAGLGRAMWLAYTNLNMPSLFAAVICSALMGMGLYAVVIVAEKRLIYWK